MNEDSSAGVSVHRLKDRLKQQTVDAILTAAENVFGKNGFDAASMNDVAKAAGVAVGTLYNHFVDRSALVAALCARRGTELLAALDAAEREHRSSPFRAQLEAFLSALLTTFQAHRGLYL